MNAYKEVIKKSSRCKICMSEHLDSFNEERTNGLTYKELLAKFKHVEGINLKLIHTHFKLHYPIEKIKKVSIANTVERISRNKNELTEGDKQFLEKIKSGENVEAQKLAMVEYVNLKNDLVDSYNKLKESSKIIPIEIFLVLQQTIEKQIKMCTDIEKTIGAKYGEEKTYIINIQNNFIGAIQGLSIAIKKEYEKMVEDAKDNLGALKIIRDSKERLFTKAQEIEKGINIIK